MGVVRRTGSNGKAIYPPITVVDCLLCDRTSRVFGASDGAGDGTDSLPWALFPQIVTNSTKTCKMSQDHKTEGSWWESIRKTSCAEITFNLSHAAVWSVRG